MMDDRDRSRYHPGSLDAGAMPVPVEPPRGRARLPSASHTGAEGRGVPGCRYCGQTLAPSDLAASRSYCSDRCRQRWSRWLRGASVPAPPHPDSELWTLTDRRTAEPPRPLRLVLEVGEADVVGPSTTAAALDRLSVAIAAALRGGAFTVEWTLVRRVVR